MGFLHGKYAGEKKLLHKSFSANDMAPHIYSTLFDDGYPSEWICGPRGLPGAAGMALLLLQVRLLKASHE